MISFSGKTLTRILRTSLLGIACLACGYASAGERDDYAVGMSPNAHLYTYFVVNGIARGAFMVGKLRQSDLPALLSHDNAVRSIIVRSMKAQNIRADFAADQALAHYLDHIPR